MTDDLSTTSSFNFEEWEKEIDSHPAFMKKLPDLENGEEPSVAFQALQALKYDDEDDTLEERARLYKEDGNKHFQFKKYLSAVTAYTEGIKLRCSDRELNAVLYANRAAAHARLGNNRSSVKDCALALKFKPEHEKAITRGAECLLALGCYAELLEWLDKYKTALPKMQELRDLATEKKAEADRNTRKAKVADRKEMEKRRELVRLVFQERRIKFRYASELESFLRLEHEFLKLNLPGNLPGSGHGSVEVHVRDGNLVWPVLFCYPEYQQTDIVQDFHEESTFYEHLEAMFLEPPEWDSARTYRPDSLEVFYCDNDDVNDSRGNDLLKIRTDATLRAALCYRSVRIVHGVPSFLILSKKTDFYLDYLKNKNVVLY